MVRWGLDRVQMALNSNEEHLIRSHFYLLPKLEGASWPIIIPKWSSVVFFVDRGWTSMWDCLSMTVARASCVCSRMHFWHFVHYTWCAWERIVVILAPLQQHGTCLVHLGLSATLWALSRLVTFATRRRALKVVVGVQATHCLLWMQLVFKPESVLRLCPTLTPKLCVHILWWSLWVSSTALYRVLKRVFVAWKARCRASSLLMLRAAASRGGLTTAITPLAVMVLRGLKWIWALHAAE